MSLRMNLGMDGCHSEEVREYFQCAAGQEKRREAKRGGLSLLHCLHEHLDFLERRHRPDIKLMTP